MKFQKIASGLLACAMVMTSVVTGDSMTVKAENQPVPIASYEFDGSLGEGVVQCGEKLASYTGAAVYGTGRDGQENGAVKLGSYGLQLKEKNIGQDFTVSFWTKPDGIIKTNSAVLFLGYHDPELWTAISGNSNSDDCKVWTNSESENYKWAGISNVSVPSAEWTMLTLAYSGGRLAVYKNGTFVASGGAAHALNGASQGIYLGVNNWDALYSGLVDDVSVYDQGLSAAQVRYLYDGTDTEQIFAEKFAAIEETMGGRNSSLSDVKYNLSLPSTYQGFDIAWSAQPAGIVSADGQVKNPAADTDVTLTATISSGSESRTKTYALKVKAAGKAAFDALLAQAKQELGNPFVTADSKAALQKVVDEVSVTADSTQAQIDSAASKIRKAMKKLVYTNNDYKDPLSLIDESNLSTSVTMTPNTTKTVFQVPAAIKDMVTVSYVSSKPAVAAVDAAGVVTAKSVGYTNVTTTVTAKYDGFSMEYQTLVRVNADMNSITAAAGATNLAKGGSTQISVKNALAGAETTYRAKGAVSVNKAGKVTGKKAGAGTVTVKVKYAGKIITKKLTFKVGDITGPNTVKVKKSITLKVTGLSGKVKWSVDKRNLATISSKGKLKAKKAGKVTVTAKVGNVSMKKTVTIKKK